MWTFLVGWAIGYVIGFLCGILVAAFHSSNFGGRE